MATIQGIMKIFPQCVGRLAIDNYEPKYWFTWGNEIKIEPVPDGVYKLSLYISDYPSTVLTGSSTDLDALPDEFQECLIYYACSMLCFKNKKWKLGAFFHELYIDSIEKRYKIYIKRVIENTSYHKI